MSGYRKEWPCCGDETSTEAWEPERCPFCELNDAQDRIAELETELEAARPQAFLDNEIESEIAKDVFESLDSEFAKDPKDGITVYTEDWRTAVRFLQAARAQQSGEGRDVAIPFALGNKYQTVSGEWVRFVKVHNQGTSYETMEDESGVNRYTNRAGDMGRVTARPVDYPGNVPPMYTHPPKAQGVPESFGDIESAVDMLEDYASALANGNLDGAGHSSYQDIHAIADNLKGIVTAPPSDNPGLDCCCGETEEAWRLCPQHGTAAPDMGGEK